MGRIYFIGELSPFESYIVSCQQGREALLPLAELVSSTDSRFLKLFYFCRVFPTHLCRRVLFLDTIYSSACVLPLDLDIKLWLIFLSHSIILFYCM